MPAKTVLTAFLILSTVLFTRPGVAEYGHRMQVVLPLAGLGCAVASGNGASYITRFVAMWATVRALKLSLGPAPINQRPNGAGQGFLSGHTAAAVFGASSLVQACLDNAPMLKTVIVVSAAFVAGSRIEAEKHDTLQVLAGAIVALLFERGLRRGSRARRRLKNWRRRVF